MFKHKLIVLLITVTLGVFILIIRYKNPLFPDCKIDNTAISFDQTRLNLGLIEHNQPKKIDFKFTNSGTNKLFIYNVSSSCGCTNINWTKKPLDPGESGSIEVIYEADIIGFFEKSMYVYCNSENGSIHLQIFGEVKAIKYNLNNN